MNPLLKRPEIFILEGKDATNLHMRNGEGQIAKTILRSGGWRWYQIITDGKSGVVMSLKLDERIAREKYRATKFFARGTWEDFSKEVAADTMPVPCSAVLEQIYGKKSETEIVAEIPQPEMEFA